MKMTITALLALVLAAAPSLALEATVPCETSAAAAALAPQVEAKLPVDGPDVPAGFYLTLSCALLSGGLGADEIAALPGAELLDKAVEGLIVDRSRADALLAILQAMKQAQVTRPEPQVVK